AMSAPGDGAKAENDEPVAKITKPIVRPRYRPNLSPRLPAVSNKPAKTRVYASTIHCSWLALAPSPPAATGFESVGSATLRIVLSIPITMRLRHSTNNVNHRRRWATSGSRRAERSDRDPTSDRDIRAGYQDYGTMPYW